MTWGIMKYALYREMLDIPNVRSSHTVPTPRGGGLSFVMIATTAAIVIWTSKTQVSPWEMDQFIIVATLGAWVAIIGFWDDHQNIPAKWRLLAHSIAAVIVIYLIGSPHIIFGSWMFDSSWISYLIFTIALIWLTNLYNFMDGIDGLAGIEAIFVASGALFLLWWNGTGTHTILWLGIIISGVSGFLILNWPPAKIFMGDVGSGYLGFIFGVIAISTAKTGDLSIWSWVILLGVFIVDATMTLLIRLIRKERWYEAHRSHTYQRLARRLNSHLFVILCISTINIFWLLPMAWCAEKWRDMGGLIAVISFVPLIVTTLLPFEPESKTMLDCS